MEPCHLVGSLKNASPSPDWVLPLAREDLWRGMASCTCLPVSPVYLLCLQVVHWQSPHMHAYYPALTSWPSLLGDMLADAINCLGFTWVSSSGCISDQWPWGHSRK